MHGRGHGIVFRNEMSHPVRHQAGQTPDVVGGLHHQPVDGLIVVTRRGVTGRVDELCQGLAIQDVFAIAADGASGPQELGYLPAVGDLGLFDDRTLFGSHGGMAQGPVGAYGHAVTAADAALRAAVHDRRGAVFAVEGNDEGRADIGTYSVAVAALRIDRKQ